MDFDLFEHVQQIGAEEHRAARPRRHKDVPRWISRIART